MDFYELLLAQNISRCLFSHFPPGLQSADFILQSPFWILPLVCSLHFTLSLLFPLVRSPQSAVCSPPFTLTVFVLAMSDLYLMWAICICCERFVFDVNDLYLMWTICNLLWWICNLLWWICNLLWAIWICCEWFWICCEWFWICCEWFEFDVSDLNLMWAFCFDVTVVGHRTLMRIS